VNQPSETVELGDVPAKLKVGLGPDIVPDRDVWGRLGDIGHHWSNG
jgi:hypothetical protein